MMLQVELDKFPEVYTRDQVNDGLRWLSVEVKTTVYNVGKAKLFSVLETMFDDPMSPRLRALKSLAEDVLLDLQHRIEEIENFSKLPTPGTVVQAWHPFISQN